MVFKRIGTSRYSSYKIKFRRIGYSVADPGCLSRIPDPDFYPSRIPDQKTATKERGVKKFFVITFYRYAATNVSKLQIM
jgi:hypothetical protein